MKNPAHAAAVAAEGHNLRFRVHASDDADSLVALMRSSPFRGRLDGGFYAGQSGGHRLSIRGCGRDEDRHFRERDVSQMQVVSKADLNFLTAQLPEEGRNGSDISRPPGDAAGLADRLRDKAEIADYVNRVATQLPPAVQDQLSIELLPAFRSASATRSRPCREHSAAPSKQAERQPRSSASRSTSCRPSCSRRMR